MLSEHDEQNYARSEQVYLRASVWLFHVDLRCHVALSTELGSKVTTAVSASNRGSKSEISNFKVEVLIKKEIFRFKISVGHTFVMYIVETMDKLLKVKSGDLF